MDKIELWPKEVYDRNLRDLLDGKSADENLAKIAEEAFALLSEEPIAPSSPYVAPSSPYASQAAPSSPYVSQIP